MRDLNEHNNRRLNMDKEYGWSGDGGNGMFEFMSPVDGQKLRVIASDEGDWDHVSVSRRSRTPTWEEMEFIKHKFFEDHETAMQLHVPVTEHINCHPYCLHLWRPQHLTIPRPPGWMVGPVIDPS